MTNHGIITYTYEISSFLQQGTRDISMEILELGLFFIILSVSTWILTWFIRKLTETLFPQWNDKSNKMETIWRDVILPLLPAVFGGLICLVKTLPFPSEIGDNLLVHAGFGVLAGFCSAYVVKVVKSQLKSKLPEATTNNTVVNEILKDEEKITEDDLP